MRWREKAVLTGIGMIGVGLLIMASWLASDIIRHPRARARAEQTHPVKPQAILQGTVLACRLGKDGSVYYATIGLADGSKRVLRYRGDDANLLDWLIDQGDAVQVETSESGVTIELQDLNQVKRVDPSKKRVEY